MLLADLFLFVLSFENYFTCISYINNYIILNQPNERTSVKLSKRRFFLTVYLTQNVIWTSIQRFLNVIYIIWTSKRDCVLNWVYLTRKTCTDKLFLILLSFDLLISSSFFSCSHKPLSLS